MKASRLRLTIGNREYLIVESRILDVDLQLPSGVAFAEVTQLEGATVITIAELDTVLRRWAGRYSAGD